MEETRLFVKGLHNDFEEQNQPEHSYTDAVNWIRGLDGSLITEKGTSIFCSNFPDKDIIGSLVIGNDIIFFLYGSTNDHEIGYITLTKDVNTTVYRSKIISPVLNFSKSHLVKAKGRLDYRTHKLVYFVDGLNHNRFIDMDKDYSNSTNLESELKLQLDSKLPEVKFVSIDSDGELPTGIYQFQARLLTSSGNKSMVSLPTNTIPVIDDNSNTKLVDGALPQSRSSKSITLSISNIDKKYKFIEIIASTYEGTSNILKVYVVGRKQILNDSISFTYYSSSQNIEEISTDEIVVEPVVYTTGKLIEYKDGHLLISGLKTNKEGTSFQKVANNIAVKYKIKEIPYSDNITFNGQSGQEDVVISASAFNNREGYSVESNVVNLKGLCREEVYSLSITPIYKNGTTGFAYHIPAPYIRDTQIMPAIPQLITKKVLVKEAVEAWEDYDEHGGIQYWPAQPAEYETITTSGGSGTCGTYLSTAEYPEGFDYPITVSKRVRHHVMPTLKDEPIYDNKHIRVLGLELSNIDLSVLSEEERKNIQGYLIGYQRRGGINKSILTQGIAQPLAKRKDSDRLFLSPFHGKGTYDKSANLKWALSTDVDDNSYYATYYKDSIGFYSPETIFYGDDVPYADYIDMVGVVSGKGAVVSSKRSDTDKRGRKVEYMHTFMNFTNHQSKTKISTPIHKDTIAHIPFENSTYAYVPPNFKTSGKAISTAKSNGFLFFHTDGEIPLWDNYLTKDVTGGCPELQYQFESSITSKYRLVRNGLVYDTDSKTSMQYADVKRCIYNLRANRQAQYGEVSDAQYVYMGHNMNNSSTIELFNGDTFISKMAIMSTTAEPHDENISELAFYTMSYVMLESSINTHYRHYTTSNGSSFKGTVPYFPKERTLWSKEGQSGLFQVNPINGHSNGYNKQYSFDAGIKKFYPKPLLLEEEVTDYGNRVIYSEVSLEGEQFDANRLFLPNNYHDVPKHKGSISDMFVHNSNLYFHTPQTLFKAYFNESTTQLSSSGELVLGNGGLFPRPSIETYTIEGGYGGSSSSSGINTPYGRIFIDEIQGKVFLLGDSMVEISMDGLSKWFRKNLSVEKESLTKGYIAAFDYANRRYILCKKGEWSISFQPELKSWSSYHDYRPTHMLSYGNRVFLADRSVIEELNIGQPGTYFGVQYDSTVTVAFNSNPLITKVADNLFTQSNECFDKIEVSNSYQQCSTKDIELVDYFNYNMDMDVIAKKKNSQYQMNIPRTDEGLRFRDKFNKIKLTVSNSKHAKFVVNYLTLLFRQNIR